MKLKFSDRVRPSVATRRRTPREIVIEALDTQIAYARAQIVGEDYQVERVRYRKDETGGKSRQKVMTKPRPWWWVEGGVHFVQILYGLAPVELKPGKPTIEAGAKLDDVISVLEQVREAATAGELDQQIADARPERQAA